MLKPPFKGSENQIEQKKMEEIGIGTDMTELEVVLEELIEKEDVAETKQRVFDNQKTKPGQSL